MLSKITIIDNVFDRSQDKEFCNVENVVQFLFNYFEKWPTNTRIYKDKVAVENEIPLANVDDVKALEQLEGDVFVVVSPSNIGPGGILGWILGIGASALVRKKKKKPQSTEENTRDKSASNRIESRTNTHRVRGRIPDIYGEVLVVPDLLMANYIVGEPGGLYEYSFYGIGRGEFEILAGNVKEGSRKVSDTPTTCLEIYGPYAEIGVDTPQLTINGAINRPFEALSEAPNSPDSPVDIRFVPYEVETEGNGNYLFSYDLENYPVNPDWFINVWATLTITVQKQNSDGSSLGSPYDVTTNAGDYITNEFRLSINHVGKVKFIFSVRFALDAKLNTVYVVEPQVLSFGNITTVYVKTLIGGTQESEEIESDTTDPDVLEAINFHQQQLIVQRIVEDRRKAKERERDLNILVTRKVPIINSDNSIGAIAPSKKFSDILYAISTDTYLGNLNPLSLDVANFRTTYNDVVAYFGTSKAGEFNHIFDDEDISFEEMFESVADSCFCTGYRRGDTLRIFFEKENNASSLLFNHRNKLPNTESRVIQFGPQNDSDGVEVEYVDPVNGEQAYFNIPYDQSAIKPEKVKVDGIRNKLQAYFHAHRLFSKLVYQNTVVEFDATSEAMLLLPNDRILVADNTRSQTMDGEIVSMSGSTLTLSQSVELDPLKNYTIFLQNADGTIQTKPVTQGVMPTEVILGSTSGLNLALDFGLYARSTYEIVENSSPRKRAFLVEEKEPQANFVTTVRAINYDARYYGADKDFINGVVNINGELI